MPLKRRVYNKKQAKGELLALIDLDIVLYQAASVCDAVSYTCCGSPPFRYKKDMVYYCHANDLPVNMIEKTVTPEPVEYCLHTIKSMINNIMEKTGATSYRGFLTGEGNYRETIDSRYPYKGHRSPEKPTHFEAAKEYLIKRWGAEVVEGMEADDMLGINQTENTIIASLDKDLDQIKGKHYNWTRDELYEVTQDEADLFFYKQLLTGDNVDNIKGLHGIGPKKAEKLLEGCTDNVSRYEVCLEEYEKAGLTYYDLLENANLLWIQREKDKHWNPPL